VVIAKLDADPVGPRREARVLDALGGRVTPTIRTPALVACGDLQLVDRTLHAVLSLAIADGPHRPGPGTVPPGYDRALADALGPVLDPSPHSGWVPQHGDLAPWNLRCTDRGLALVDWETAGYAPPGTDAAHLALTSVAVRGGTAPPIEPTVAAHLRSAIAERTDPEDRALTHRLLSLLDTAVSPGARP
jgi:hypothetical protein